MRKVFTSLCLLHLISLTRQSQSSRPAGQNSASSSFPVCPEGRGEEERKKVCSNVTECETVCEKEDCQTNYKYRKDYRRQKCVNKWKYFCGGGGRGRSRGRRGAGRTGRLFWRKLDKLLSLLSPRTDPSPGPEPQLGSESQSDPGECWRLVRECRWVTYKTVCANKPTTVCKELIPVCAEQCTLVEYCSPCPSPPAPPSPPSPPAPPGPPSPPPSGTFIVSPPAPPSSLLQAEVIEA